MRIKEHNLGCMCDACQAASMQNIDGYASGYELAPDPDQEIQSNKLQDPNFIKDIISQVLQQLQDTQLEETTETNEQWGGQELEATPELQVQQNYQQSPGSGPGSQMQVPIGSADHLQIWQTFAKDPCGKTLYPFYETDKEKFPVDWVGANDAVYQSTGDIKNIFKEGKSRSIEEFIRNEVQKLINEKEIEEGSCGYSVNGEGGNTPAGSHLLKKTDLQERFKKLAGIIK